MFKKTAIKKKKLNKEYIIKSVCDSPFKGAYPKFLLDFCSSYESEEESLIYDIDCPIIDNTSNQRSEARQTYRNTIRYPTRLNAPLVKMDKGFFTAREYNYSQNADGYRQYSINKLYTLKRKWVSITGKALEKFNYYCPDMDEILTLEHVTSPHVNTKYKKVINKVSLINLNKELNMATKSNRIYNLAPEHLPEIPDMLAIFLSARAQSLEDISGAEKLKNYYMDNEEYKAIIIDSEAYIYYKFKLNGNVVFFICSDSYVSWTIDNGTDIRMMDYEYLDYLLTLTEISYNMKIMSAMPEFNWARESFKLLEELKTLPMDYNNKVAIMKSMETIFQLSPESTSKSFHSVEPILDCLFGVYETFYDAELIQCEFDFFLLQFYRLDGIKRGDSWIERMLGEALQMTPQQSLEFSSCHKFIYYAEISESAGINKFMKRTFTKRPVEKEAIIDMIGMFNYEFLNSYVDKHKYLPELVGNKETINMIKEAHRYNNWKSLELYPINWWSEITIRDALSHDIITDPLEYAKDKGSCKSEVSYGSQDSSKELFDVISKPDYTVELFPFLSIDKDKEKSIEIREESLITHKVIYPCKLAQKEREQKEEGRLFGALNTESKHSLSRLMKMAKIVLGYFTEQFMTITDKDRKLILHQMAQMTLESDIVSLLADIEGHNQSMQPDNTSELCRRIGLLYGEEDWDRLSYFFSNLTVIYPRKYINKCYVIKGQLGGIEGFFNPVWTLHSLLMMKLFRKESGIDMPALATYSDDIALLLRLATLEQDSLNDMLKRLKRHCLRFGMIVKTSQTIVSQHRITMLRKSYYDGLLCDPTIKRLLSHTMFNCELYSSEEIEISSVTSATSSALELTNHPITCCLIKWIKCTALSVRTFSNTFTDINIESSIIPELLPQEIYTAINPLRDIENLLQSLDMKAIKQNLINDKLVTKEMLKDETSYEDWRKVIMERYGRDMTYERRKNVSDTIMSYLLDNKDLQDIYFIFALTPVNYSGLGVIPDLYLSVTGLSDSTARMMDYIYCYTVNYSQNSKNILSLLDNILSVDTINKRLNNNSHLNLDYLLPFPPDTLPAYSAKSLLISNFPSGHRDNSASKLITKAVKEVFQVNCKNKAIIKLMNDVAQMEELNDDIINIFRLNYYPRIAQFYSETNIKHIYNSLLGKIESTSSFLRRYRNLPKLRRKLIACTLWKAKNFFTLRRKIVPALKPNTDIMMILIDRRKIMFPGLSIVDIAEAQYESYISACNYEERNLVISTDRIKETRDNKLRYKSPKFGSEALYKGEMVDTGTILFKKAEVLAVKLLAITKWILYKTTFTIEMQNDQSILDVVQACNLSLRTLGFPTYEELHMHVSLPGGGEIAHRLKTFSYITSSTIRSLPTLSTKYIGYIDNSWISMHNLEDGNIHFDYVRHRLSYLAAIKYAAYHEEAFIDHYKLKHSGHYQNVQIIISKKSPVMINPEKYGIIIFEINPLTTSRVLFMSELEVDDYDISNTAALKKHKNITDSKKTIMMEARSIIVDFNKTLITEWMEPFDTMFKKYTWQPLIKKMHSYFIALNIVLDKEKEKFIEDTLIHYYTYFTLDEEIPLPILDLKSMLMEVEDQFREKHEDFCRSIDLVYTKLSHHSMDSDYTRRIRSLLKLFAKRHSDPFLRMASINILIVQVLLQGIIKFKFIYGKVIVDYPSTLVLFEEVTTPNKYSYYSKAKPYVILLNTLLELEYVDISRLVKRGIELINNMLGEIGLNHFQIQHKIDPKKIRSQDIMFSTIKAADLTFPISILIGNTDIYTHMDKFLQLIHVRERVILNSGNPLVYNSTRGSDTYTMFNSIFKQLIYEKIIDKDTRILDLCAGRGELRDAADRYDLKIDSYGRADIYTMIDSNRSVDYSTNIDLTDINTLPNITPYDLIIIDISFIKGYRQSLWNTIIHFLRDQKRVMIRLNSLDNPDDLYITDLLMVTNKIGIILMDDLRNSHPNVYLLITPKAPDVRKSRELSRIDNYTPHIVAHMKQLAQIGLTLDVPLGENLNSATNMLILNEGIYAYFDEIIEQQSTPLTEKYNNMIQNSRELLEEIIIDEYTYLKLKNKKEFTEDLPRIINMPDPPKAKETIFLGSSYEKFKMRWWKPGNKWYKCNLFSLNILQVPLLIRHHAERKVKYLSKKYLYLLTAGFYVPDESGVLDLETYRTINDESYTKNNKVSKLYRKVLPVLLVEIYRDNIASINEQYRLKFFINGYNDTQIKREYILIKKLLCASKEFFNLLRNYSHIDLLMEKLKLMLLDHQQTVLSGVRFGLSNQKFEKLPEINPMDMELKNINPAAIMAQFEEVVASQMINAVNRSTEVTHFTTSIMPGDCIDEYVASAFSFGLENRFDEIEAFFSASMSREEALMDFYGGDYEDYDPDYCYLEQEADSPDEDEENSSVTPEDVKLNWADEVPQ